MSNSIAQKMSFLDRYLTLWRQDRDAGRALILGFTDQAVAAVERMVDGLIERFAVELNMQSLTNEQFQELIMDTEKKYHFHGA